MAGFNIIILVFAGAGEELAFIGGVRRVQSTPGKATP
jgi:hypothetical protein